MLPTIRSTFCHIEELIHLLALHKSYAIPSSFISMLRTVPINAQNCPARQHDFSVSNIILPVFASMNSAQKDFKKLAGAGKNSCK